MLMRAWTVKSRKAFFINHRFRREAFYNSRFTPCCHDGSDSNDAYDDFEEDEGIIYGSYGMVTVIMDRTTTRLFCLVWWFQINDDGIFMSLTLSLMLYVILE